MGDGVGRDRQKDDALEVPRGSEGRAKQPPHSWIHASEQRWSSSQEAHAVTVDARTFADSDVHRRVHVAPSMKLWLEIVLSPPPGRITPTSGSPVAISFTRHSAGGPTQAHCKTHSRNRPARPPSAQGRTGYTTRWEHTTEGMARQPSNQCQLDKHKLWRSRSPREPPCSLPPSSQTPDCGRPPSPFQTYHRPSPQPGDALLWLH